MISRKYYVKSKIILLIKNIKNARFKKKISYKFIGFFGMIDINNTRIYHLKLLNNE